jgi:hypothetical protein
MPRTIGGGPGGGVIVPDAGDLLLLLPGTPVTPPDTSLSGLSRIIYNNKALDFPAYPQDLQPYYGISGTDVKARTGISQTLIVPRVDCEVEIEFNFQIDADQQMFLRCWWAWALQGLPWFFALDSQRTVLTTLTQGCLAGALTATVADVTGIAIGQRYYMRSGPNHQIVKIADVTGPIVQFTTPIDFDFFIGAIFRTEYFWPAKLGQEYRNDDPFQLIPAPADWFHFRLKFEEDLN